MKLLLFTKKDCPNCPLAKKVVKEVAEELGIELEEVDAEEDMLKALQYSVASTPSLVLVRNGDYEVLFRSEVPSREELVKAIKALEAV